MRSEPRRGWPRARRRALRAGLFVARAALLVALPFVLLIRGSLLLNAGLGWNAWLSLALGALASALLLSLYGWALWRRLTSRSRFRRIATRIALPVVAVFCGYGLLFLSAANAKTPQVRDSYASLQPVLRLAVATLVLVDAEIVLTDIERSPDAYASMGLAAPNASHHYRREDGWVHAVDLRTRGRGAVRNGLLRLWFEALGFDTLRHVGTADHLHVSLP